MKKTLIIFFAVFATFFFYRAHSASAFTCTVTASGSAQNWSTAATWSTCNSTFPQAGDDVVFNASSSNVVVDVGTANLNSFVMTGYTGTLSGSATIRVGGSAGTTQNVIFAGTISWTGLLNLTPNAATANLSLTSNSKTLSSITINGNSSSSVILADNLTTTSGATITITQGGLQTDGASNNSGLAHSWGTFTTFAANTRSLNLGSSSITTSGGFTVAGSGLTFNAGTSNLTIGASLTNGPLGLSYNNLTFNGTGYIGAVGNASFTVANLTLNSGSASKTIVRSFGVDVTVTSTFTVAGNSSVNRLLVNTGNSNGDTLGTARTVTVTGATVSANNVDFKDITFARATAGGLDLTNGGANSIGDCGGNSRTGGDGTVTFTPAVDQHWQNASGGSWSTAANWTSRVPLPQDNVFMDKAFGTAQTVTSDMPRLGKNIDWTGATWTTSLTWSKSITHTIFGNMTLISGLTSSGVQNLITESGTRTGIQTWKSNGVAFVGSLVIQNVGTTLQLQDDINVSTVSTVISSITGTFDANNFNVTVNNFTTANTSASITNMGSGIWTITGAGAVWNLSGNSVINSNSSTIVMSNVTASAKTFSGVGKTYYNATFTGENITIAGSNTFTGTLALNNPGTATGTIFTANTTTTVAAFTTNATSTANPAKILSSSSGSAWRIVKSGGGTISVDYMSIKDSAASPAKTWYAGQHSVNVSGNTGWNFFAPSPTQTQRSVVARGGGNNSGKIPVKVHGGGAAARTSPVAFVNAVAGNATNNTSTASMNMSAGNLVFLFGSANGSGSGCGSNTFSLSDTGGNSWSQIGSNVSQAFNCAAAFYARNINGGTSTISMNYSAGGGTGKSFVAMQFSGLDRISNPLDTNATGTASSGSVVKTGTFSTGSANEVIVAGAGNYYVSGSYTAGTTAGQAMTIPSGATSTAGLDGLMPVAVEYLITSSTLVSASTSLNFSGTMYSNIITATFRAAATAGVRFR